MVGKKEVLKGTAMGSPKRKVWKSHFCVVHMTYLICNRTNVYDVTVTALSWYKALRIFCLDKTKQEQKTQHIYYFESHFETETLRMMKVILKAVYCAFI